MSLPGGWEWVIIILFVLVFFGAKRLPDMAKGLGKGIREFKSALSGVQEEIEKAGSLPKDQPANTDETKKEDTTKE